MPSDAESAVDVSVLVSEDVSLFGEAIVWYAVVEEAHNGLSEARSNASSKKKEKRQQKKLERLYRDH